MKKLKKLVFATVAALALCALTTTPALAYYRGGGFGRGFHGYHGWGGPRFSFGFSYAYAPPVYYYPPPAVVYSPYYYAPGPVYYYSGGCFYRY